ncbi:MAG: DUF4177 domain-containing protein [Candidatus Latescibacteria bacterium]|nr:DUF4177 domain-containing protein [Candidatus Latescibacterota bacterium]NIM22046.1 DUF4177 domain-containing protein [Candidatus Latescibacterota bacterium]NIM66064.1 DUF4177 domain-containing protein [Candidatus Latescibacterota bacterium]NIO02472.1 DUF4177 domain-containing protein [Candidatus Latescibacterota bacterium]NIO29383.1 DUF4177 domain-containing protein [Candidatus Latescibacterota bacterium]
MIQQAHECKYIRLKERCGSGSRPRGEKYQDVIREYEREGWQLVQILRPGIELPHSAKHFELIFKRDG